MTSPPRPDPNAPRATMVPAHEFPYGVGRRWRFVASGLKLSVLAVPLLAVERTRAAGLAGLATLLLAALVFALALRRVAVAVDARGLRLDSLGLGLLAWQDIAAVRFVRLEGIAHLVVERTPAGRAARRGSRRLRRAARRVGGRDLAMPLVGLRDDPKRVSEVVALALAIARRDQAAARS